MYMRRATMTVKLQLWIVEENKVEERKRRVEVSRGGIEKKERKVHNGNTKCKEREY